jgi:putative lipoprotein
MRASWAAAVALSLALGGAAPVRADPPDPWFGHDKALHFGASATISAAGYGAGAWLSDDARVRWIAGAGLGLTAGVAKELWDLAGHGDPSWRDLTWDVVGTASGLAVAAAIDWALGRLHPTRPVAPHVLVDDSQPEPSP